MAPACAKSDRAADREERTCGVRGTVSERRRLHRLPSPTRCVRSSRTAARHLTGWALAALERVLRPLTRGDRRVGRPASSAGMATAPTRAAAAVGSARRSPRARRPIPRRRGPRSTSSPTRAPRRRTPARAACRSAHKPGAIPLRPLVLGDIFDGAFRIIRYNPRATSAPPCWSRRSRWCMPVVTGLVTGSTGGLRFDPNSDGLTNGQVASLVAAFGVAPGRHPAAVDRAALRLRDDRPRDARRPRSAAS